jgi:glycosyltransferase involved in cell wall biosynthesis
LARIVAIALWLTVSFKIERHLISCTLKPPPMIKISLIIPAYNEEDYLPSLLESVDVACKSFKLGASSIEVIVVDNQSTDDTAAVADEKGCLVVQENKRIIGAVRNTGAGVAQGEILAFTDADNILHPDTFNKLYHTISSPKVIGGATGVRSDRMSLGIACAYAIVVPMVWVTGMDTGVVFCRKKDFQNAGGYSESHLFGEDVAFLWRLIKYGRRRGRRFVRVRGCKAINSTRKFDQFGEWHYVRLVFKYLRSIIIRSYSIDNFARTYWYSDRGSAEKKIDLA